MKTKILLSFAILFCAAITTNAQINEGKYLLGGSVSFSSSKQQQGSEAKNQSFLSNIQFGKVIKPNTAAGILLSYGNTNNKQAGYKLNLYSAGVFYRKYKPLTKDFYLFGEADALYSYSRATQGNFQIGRNGIRNTSNAGSISFTPGISYSICKRVQMELLMQDLVSISYGTSKSETSSASSTTITSSKQNDFSGNANLNGTLLSNFGIGFKFLLGK